MALSSFKLQMILKDLEPNLEISTEPRTMTQNESESLEDFVMI